MTLHRQFDKEVAPFAGQTRHTGTFGTEYQRQRQIEVGVIVHLGSFVVFDANHPHPLFLQAFDALCQIGDYGDLQMFNGARRGVDDGRGDFGGTPTRDNHTMHADHFAVRNSVPRFWGSCR